MKDNSVWKSSALKVIATILLSFLALGIVYTSAAILFNMDTGDDAFTATRNRFAYQLRDETYTVCDNLANGAKPSQLQSYTANTNYRIEVKDATSGKTVFSNVTEDEVLTEVWYEAGTTNSYLSDTIIGSTSPAIQYEAGKNSYLSDTKSADSTYYVRYGLSEQMEEADEYRDYYEVYDFFSQTKSLNIFGLVLFGILFVLDLFYLCIRAGKKRGSDDAELIWFDRIPLDVCAVIFCCIGAMWLAITEGALSNINVSLANIVNVVALAMVVSFPIGYLMLTWLLGLARRIKTGTLSQGILTWVILKALVSWVARLCTALPTVLLAGIFLILYAVFCMSRDGLLVFIAFLMGCFGLYVAWEYNEIQKVSRCMATGDLSVSPDLKHMWGNLKKTAENLVDVRRSVSAAVDKQVKSERLKSELITNVSHDICTPLTSIVNYVDLLKKETTEEQRNEYLEALDRNSQRLKKLTDDLIEASKASSGNITVSLMPLSVNEIVDQAMGEYSEKLEQAKLEPVVHFEKEKIQAIADGRLLWRVLSNLLSNVVKYAMPSTRVYVDVFEEGKTVKIVVKNISAQTLNIPAEELMERFVRADASRHDGGSGLGLDIAKSLTTLQNGTFTIDIDGDLFKAVIELEKA